MRSDDYGGELHLKCAAVALRQSRCQPFSTMVKLWPLSDGEIVSVPPPMLVTVSGKVLLTLP